MTSGGSSALVITQNIRLPESREIGSQWTSRVFRSQRRDDRLGSGFESLLELAEACDVPVRWSCRTGVCHSCETGLIAGAVNYDPVPLESPADGNLLTCCSRPRSDVVIDL